MKKYLLMILCLALSACNVVDNYMLGKDNTPIPKPLPVLKAKVQLKSNWEVPVGKATNANNYLKLRPVIIGNTIYVANSDGLVQALNKKTGKILWSSALQHEILSGPIVKNGYIAVGTSVSSVILLQQANGKMLWEKRLSGDVLAKPTITAKYVFVKTIDGNLYSLDLKTGNKIWVYLHGSPNLILKASSSPVLHDNLILVGFSDGKFDAVDAQSGHLVWQKNVAYPRGGSDVERLVDIDADPLVRGDIVYLASYQDFVGALSLSNGEYAWSKAISTYKNLSIDSDTLYLTDSQDVLWAIDRLSGQVKWKQLMLQARALTEPVVIGNRLIVGDKMGFLHVLSKQNGALLGRTQLSGAIFIAPTAIGDNVYVMTANGKLNSLTIG